MPADVYAGEPGKSGLLVAGEVTLPKPKVDVLLRGEIVPRTPVEELDCSLEIGPPSPKDVARVRRSLLAPRRDALGAAVSPQAVLAHADRLGAQLRGSRPGRPGRDRQTEPRRTGDVQEPQDAGRAAGAQLRGSQRADLRPAQAPGAGGVRAVRPALATPQRSRRNLRRPRGRTIALPCCRGTSIRAS